MKQPDLFYSADEQKSDFFEAIKAGKKIDCPCCGRHSQIYRRTLHAGIVLSLMKLYRMTKPEEYLHIEKFCSISGGTDTPLARFWNLIEAKTNDDESKSASGEWRLTNYGRMFIRNEIRIAKYIFLFDNQYRGASEEGVTIIDCLREKFNYQELMSQ